MANRFRDPIMRDQYDNLVRAYDNNHRDLFRADGGQHLGNSAAAWFWRGFNGTNTDGWDAASKKMIIYACWRAGVDIRADDSRQNEI